jgi:hypothetical protein
VCAVNVTLVIGDASSPFWTEGELSGGAPWPIYELLAEMYEIVYWSIPDKSGAYMTAMSGR